MIQSSSKKTNSNHRVLELKNIVKSYVSGNTAFNALDNVSLCINQGEFISITGPSGSGKSTLMHIVGLLDNPTSGQVLLEGQDISHLNEEELAKTRNVTLGFVFQQFNLLAKTSAIENVSLPLLYSDVPKSERLTKSIEMLQKVGLGDKLKNTPAQLSGGQQQRVAIARALVNDAPLILADEPTGNLDTKTSIEIMELLVRLNRDDHMTIVLVTHEHDIAAFSCRIIHFLDGCIVSDEAHCPEWKKHEERPGQ